MNGLQFMLIAGETSGDSLGAELVLALKKELATAPFSPRFFGLGGQQMKRAGVELQVDMTENSIVGIADVFRYYFRFRKLFHSATKLARKNLPDAIVLIDFSGFNLRFAEAIRNYVSSRENTFHNWKPKLFYYAGPQVWASRAKRAKVLEETIDHLISIIPFERKWYDQHAPKLKVTYVGHPMADRYHHLLPAQQWIEPRPIKKPPRIVLLPGSRKREISDHLKMLNHTARILHDQLPSQWKIVVPTAGMLKEVKRIWEIHNPSPLTWDSRSIPPLPSSNCLFFAGSTHEQLLHVDLAFSKSGTVSLECAYFRVPTVVFYRVSRLNYWIGKMFVTVRYLAMPNLLSEEEVFPEFIQSDATPSNLVSSGLRLLREEKERQRIIFKLNEVAATLGSPGAPERAARTIIHDLGR